MLSAVAKRKLQQRREESQVGVAPNSTGSVGPTTTTEPLEPFPEREHELISAKASEDARQENRWVRTCVRSVDSADGGSSRLDETKAPTSQPVELSTFKAHRDTLKKTAGNGLILRIREGEVWIGSLAYHLTIANLSEASRVAWVLWAASPSRRDLHCRGHDKAIPSHPLGSRPPMLLATCCSMPEIG